MAVRVSNPHSRTSYQSPVNVCTREAVDAPIVLDDDEPNDELNATISDGDGDGGYGTNESQG